MNKAKTGRFPDFMVIGAMKSGTTTLYNELAFHPDVLLAEKELNYFIDSDCLESEKIENYCSLFPDTGLTGDVSTTYSMLPTYQNVAERALSVLKKSIPLIYIVRNPIYRAISHHHHLQARGTFVGDFESAIDAHPELLEYGRYEVQLKPWIQYFGADSLLVLKLEAFKRNPVETRNKIAKHLGLEESRFPSGAIEHSNKTDTARVLSGVSRKVMDSGIIKQAYRKVLRPAIPLAVKKVAKEILLPKPPERDSLPTVDSLDKMKKIYETTDTYISELTNESNWDMARTVKDIVRNKAEY